MSSTLEIKIRKLTTWPQIPTSERETLFQKIQAMMQREPVYRCHDYTSREEGLEEVFGDFSHQTKKKKRKLNENKFFIVSDEHRKDMCEWSFRIVDHFNGSRELVAIAQNYLDRFLDTHHW